MPSNTCTGHSVNTCTGHSVNMGSTLLYVIVYSQLANSDPSIGHENRVLIHESSFFARLKVDWTLYCYLCYETHAYCVCDERFTLRCKGIVVACGSEGYSLCVSEHSSDANADPANIIIIIIIMMNDFGYFVWSVLSGS